MALADLNVKLGLATQAFEKGLSGAQRSLRRFGRQVEFIGQDLTQALTIPIAAAGAAAVKSFADFEKSAKSLEAVVGSAEETAIQLERLRKVAQLPGLGFQEAVQASARLQAVGLSAQEAEAAITEFGNAVARSGGGRQEFDGAILALTQIASKGKISAEEINQLNERIFEIRPALKAAFGTANSEELQKLGISSEEFIARTTAELAKLERVQGGLANAFENFSDSARTSLATLGEEISRALNLEGILDTLSRQLDNIVTLFKNLDEGTKTNIVRFAAFAAAIGPVLLATGKLILATKSILSTFELVFGAIKGLSAGLLGLAANPLGLVIAGIAALAAGAVIAYQRSEEFRRIVDALGAAFVEAFKIARERFDGILRIIQAVFGAARDIFSRTFSNLRAGLVSAFEVAAPVFRRIGDIIVGFGKVTATVFVGALNIINGFVRGVINVVGELARIIREGVQSFLQGLKQIEEGDFAGALKSFGDGLKKSNPIGIALTQGRRLADSFNEGFEAGFGEVDRIVAAFTQKYNEQLASADIAPIEPEIVPAEGGSGGGGGGAGGGGGVTSATEQNLFNFKALADGLAPSVATIAAGFDQATASATQFGTQVAVANETALIGSNAAVALGESVNLVGDAFERMNTELLPQNASLLQQIGIQFDALGNAVPSFTSAVQGGLKVFGDAMQFGVDSVKDLAKAVFKASVSIIKNLIQQGVAAAVANALKNPAGIIPPLGVALAAAAGAAAAGLFGSLVKAVAPGFAAGGLVTGPTLALVGEGIGTSRANPEVISPLNKLKDIIGDTGGGRGFIASARISGSDLLILLEDEQARQGRIK